MATATERWSDSIITQKIDGNYVGQRGWDVIAYSDDDDMLAATGLPAIGDAHNLIASLFCTDLKIAENKLTKGVVKATYEVTSLIANPVDPTARQPRLRWRPGKVSVSYDCDQAGNPLVNSAGDAPRSSFSRNFSVRYFSVSIYKASFDRAGADQFSDTINNGDITLCGEDFAAGTLYCQDITPCEEYQEDATYLKITGNFEVRTPQGSGLTDAQIRYPFALRFLDQGMRGKATVGGSSGLQPLYTADGKPVSRDVLFNGAGQPMDSTIKATAAQLAVASGSLPTEVHADGDVQANFLVYTQWYQETDFSDLVDYFTV
jgi:hypothetical protein